MERDNDGRVGPPRISCVLTIGWGVLLVVLACGVVTMLGARPLLFAVGLVALALNGIASEILLQGQPAPVRAHIAVAATMFMMLVVVIGTGVQMWMSK